MLHPTKWRGVKFMDTSDYYIINQQLLPAEVKCYIVTSVTYNTNYGIDGTTFQKKNSFPAFHNRIFFYTYGHCTKNNHC
jgi:hypothetical protein